MSATPHISGLGAPAQTVLKVSDLRIELQSGRSVVEDVSLSLGAGETLGLAGESGSGKTTLGLAFLGYPRDGMRIAGGKVEVGGNTIAPCNKSATRRLRGGAVSYVPQESATSLNPSLRIGGFISDMLAGNADVHVSETTVFAALEAVHLPGTKEFARRFPHQLSGGQQQRVLIASAMGRTPQLVVFDEPTTGLDVVTQARVLDEIARLHREHRVAVVYISHDLAVVAQIAHRVAVMYAGRIVEDGPALTVLTRPRHPYTRGLVAAIPDHAARKRLQGIPGVAVGLYDRPSGCAFAPRCPQKVARCELEVPPLDAVGPHHAVRCIEAERTPAPARGERLSVTVLANDSPVLVVEHLTAVHTGGAGTVTAARDVSFNIAPGECVALVGESGSGKTTIARAIVGLHPPAAGTIRLGDTKLAPLARRRSRQDQQRCQIIFQNPYESLNPRRSVQDQIGRPARILRGLSASACKEEVARLLERVRLPQRAGSKYPSELSGGERQRVAIARALAAAPELLICDEITSALDVSVQAAVIELLAEIRADLFVAVLFITHNLGVVASIADRVLVLASGDIVESGPVDSVFAAPEHPYTQQLLRAAPTMTAAGEIDDPLGDLSSAPVPNANPSAL